MKNVIINTLVIAVILLAIVAVSLARTENGTEEKNATRE